MEKRTRTIAKILNTKATLEGAGVHLKRAFGYEEVPLLDPFLLLDDFSSNDPKDYILGFPWHPHRGIETVTYVIAGRVEHEDSMGNKGVINSGDVQWMTAGSGIIHQEMPQEYEGAMHGFQLWVNLPAKDKMMHPRYQGIDASSIPTFEKNSVRIKVIAGEVEGVRGPVQDIMVRPAYFDVSLAPGAAYAFDVVASHKVFAYVFEGSAQFDETEGGGIEAGHLAIFSDGERVLARAGERGTRFLFVSGKPIGEPVAWYGPIVMNTQEELKRAFEEYRAGTFIKHAVNGR